MYTLVVLALASIILLTTTVFVMALMLRSHWGRMGQPPDGPDQR
jgi:hypothetical protein